MLGFKNEMKSIRLLIIGDVESENVTKITEYFVPKRPFFDCVLICGPFCREVIENREDEAKEEGNMTSIIAQLESIVCRVIYLPSDLDPVTTLVDELHLTPNSISIHARTMPLCKGLYISGFTEKDELLNSQSSNKEEKNLNDIDDEYYVESSSSIDIIEEMFQGMAAVVKKGIEEDSSKSYLPASILILNYKYFHTLNHVLFHCGAILKKACVSTCIIPKIEEDNVNIPSYLNGMHIIRPKSLRQGFYTVAIYECNSMTYRGNQTNSWNFKGAETYQIGIKDAI